MNKPYPRKNGPWTVLSSEIKYQNPWITVREDQVLRPDGLPGIYGVVQPKHAVGVVALETCPDNGAYKVYLVGQYRYPTEVYSWELIEGGSEEGEDTLETAKRELQEEAGLSADEWFVLSENIQLSNSHTSEIAVIYLAKGLTKGESSPDGTEELSIKSVYLSEAVQMAVKGEITDALSIMGLLLAEKHLLRGA